MNHRPLPLSPKCTKMGTFRNSCIRFVNFGRFDICIRFVNFGRFDIEKKKLLEDVMFGDEPNSLYSKLTF